MRKLTNGELQKIYNEEDMLKGCINRMCVTKDMMEFNAMYKSAIDRINRLTNICVKRFLETVEDKECDDK